MKHFNRFLTTFTILFFGQSIWAAAPPPPPGAAPSCWPPPCVPIDGGVYWLIAAGAALSAWKLYSLRKASQSQS